MPNAIKKVKSDETALDYATKHYAAELEELKELDEKVEDLREECEAAKRSVEMSYESKYNEIFDQRNKKCEKIPKFWKTVLTEHPAWSGLIDALDEPVLDHLSSITCRDTKDAAGEMNGYEIRFYFNKNEYFKNKYLSKIVTFPEETEASVAQEDAELPIISSSPIQWTSDDTNIFKLIKNRNIEKKHADKNNIINENNGKKRARFESNDEGEDEDDLGTSLFEFFDNENDDDDISGQLMLIEMVKDEVVPSATSLFLGKYVPDPNKMSNLFNSFGGIHEHMGGCCDEDDDDEDDEEDEDDEGDEGDEDGIEE